MESMNKQGRLEKWQSEAYYNAIAKGKICAILKKGEKFPFADEYEELFTIEDKVYCAYDNPFTTTTLR